MKSYKKRFFMERSISSITFLLRFFTLFGLVFLALNTAAVQSTIYGVVSQSKKEKNDIERNSMYDALLFFHN